MVVKNRGESLPGPGGVRKCNVSFQVTLVGALNEWIGCGFGLGSSGSSGQALLNHSTTLNRQLVSSTKPQAQGILGHIPLI